jgi:hypothetical protein
MNGVDMLAAQPYVDANRMGAAGASYGGYMINWLLGHTTRFKALVSHDGVYNLESMYGATEELWFPEWEFGGTPWDKPELYQSLSPHKYAKNCNADAVVMASRLPRTDRALQPSPRCSGAACRHGSSTSRTRALGAEAAELEVRHQTVLGWFDRWLGKYNE